MGLHGLEQGYLYLLLPERRRILDNFRSFKNEVKTLLIIKAFYPVDKFVHSKF
jgi:hypothetical protein